MTLNSTDYKKIAKGAAIAFSAAALYSISQALTSGIIDWKIYIPAAIAVGINAVLKLLAGPAQ